MTTQAPTDLDILFQRDPLKLTKEDRTAIIMEYRRRRAQFDLEGVRKGKKAKKAKGDEGEAKSADDLLNTVNL